jgi:acyl carrier protein
MSKLTDEQDEQLMRCFEAVFPSLTQDQVRAATPDAVADWNSLSAITLVAVIEEEFKIKIPLMDLAELDSYGAFREYLSSKFSSHMEAQ